MSAKLEEVEAKSKARDGLWTHMMERHTAAANLEASGDIQGTLDLNERSLYDGWSGKTMYERLRIIYTQRGDHDGAIRAVEANIKYGHPTEGWAKKQRERLAKLEAMKEGSRAQRNDQGE